MEELLKWVKDIAYYLIFMAAVATILPDKKYEKYMKLFAGMVLLLLVLKPLTSGLRIEDRIAYYFESITFQKEVSELTQSAGALEERRLQKLSAQYESVITHDIGLMASGQGLSVKDVVVSMETDAAEGTPGAVHSLTLTVASGGEESAGQEEIAVKVDVPMVEPVGGAVKTEEKIQPDTSINRLRKQIGEYYNLEEGQIEIQVEQE